jgi:hypothetical protein
VGRYLCQVVQEATPWEDVEILRKFELRKCDVWEKNANQGLQKSFEDEVTIKETLTKSGDIVELKTTKPQSGNPAWQRALTDIAKRRAALTGMDKPHKVEVDKTERRLTITEVVVTREQIQAEKAAGLLK